MIENDLIRLEKDRDGIATLILNRPDKLNAFTVPMIQQWHAALEEAVEDPAVKVIVLTGEGSAFCAGGDMDDIAKFEEMDNLERKNYLWKSVHKIVFTLERCDKPVIAAVNGLAFGAGMDMTLMCDLRIAGRSALFAESYINLGLIAGDAGTFFLPRLIGMSRALDLFWTGRRVTAEEALQMGLVNRVVEDGRVREEARKLALSLAGQPQEAIRCFKRAIWQSLSMPLGAHLDMISSHMAVLEDDPDHRARVSALLARRNAH